MQSKMFYNNIQIVNWKPSGSKLNAELENGDHVTRGDLVKPLFEIECGECGAKKSINYRPALRNKKYTCQACNKSGKNNPFYGKKHTQEFKEQSSVRMKGRYVGENNPFYGKKHTDETREKIKKSHANRDTSGKNNPFYGQHHTKETKERLSKTSKSYFQNLTEEERVKLSEKLSATQQKFKRNDPAAYRKMKQKAARASCISQKKYKKNKIEKMVESEFHARGLYPEYSVIIGYNQYDFGFKDSRLLVEIQGDYWHGNPSIYKESHLNHIQQHKRERDEIKKEFAISRDFKIYYIWESEIYDGSYLKIVDEIERVIKHEV